MTVLFALITGLLSWIILLYCIIRCKHFNNLKIAKLQVLSWALCSIALYFPSLTLKLEHLSDNYRGMIDAVSPFHLAELTLLLVNVLLNITLLLINSKSKKQSDI